MDNEIIAGLSGKLAIRHMRDGRALVLSRPNLSDRVFSLALISRQSRFQMASAYAKVAAKTQPVYAGLSLRTPEPACNIALSDWIKPPVTHAVLCQDGRVCATANVQVAGVRMTVVDLDRPRRKDQAVRVNDTREDDEACADGDVLAEAFALAGNITSQET